MTVRIALCICLIAFLPSPTRADSEGPAGPVVYACGRYYAKSVPDSPTTRTKGRTQVFRVRADDDELVYTFDWYAPALHLRQVKGPLSIVRIGGWPRGRLATHDQLALAFYLDDQELKVYTTLDIAGTPENVCSSVSHHIVLERIYGYRSRWTPDCSRIELLFEVRTIDARVLSFDPHTGELREPSTLGELLDP